MNPPPSNSSGQPSSPTSEAWALRAEWRDGPPTLEREEAGRALEALSRAGAEASGRPATDDVPPVPEDLRRRWAEAYGRPGTAEGALPPRRVEQERRDRGERSFGEWLGSLLTPRRMAWGGGVGAAVAAVAMVFFQDGGAGTPGTAASLGLVTRGGPAAGGGGVAVPVAVISPVAAAEMKDGVVALLQEAFPGRRVSVLASANEAAALAQRESRLVVVNLGSGLVTAWNGGQLADEFPLGSGATPASVIGQVESADERLEAVAPVAP